jgi:hypothetical protein
MLSRTVDKLAIRTFMQLGTCVGKVIRLSQ